MLAKSTKEYPKEKGAYSLRVQICWLALRIDEISINPCLINSVKLSLVYEKVGFAQ